MSIEGYDADVAIIGYGPSGVAAANALGHWASRRSCSSATARSTPAPAR